MKYRKLTEKQLNTINAKLPDWMDLAGDVDDEGNILVAQWLINQTLQSYGEHLTKTNKTTLEKAEIVEDDKAEFMDITPEDEAYLLGSDEGEAENA